MNITAIVIAAAVLGAMGLVFGALLGVTGKVFHIDSNPKIGELREVLPGANCGACGYPGCDGYASAVAEGKAEIGLCAVGGPAVAAKMGEIMGVEATVGARMVASVACQGYGDHCAPKAEYEGIHDCVAATLANSGTKACQYACLGLGTCERACPFDAIHIDPIRKIAVVDEDKCQACRKCVAACPQHVLVMRPAERAVQVGCHNPEKGMALKEKCDRACVACEACVKACNFGAIAMENNVPKIDYDQCIGCMACADACPTGAMEAKFETRKEAWIDPDKCIGCTICARTCKFDAIQGELKKTHKVLGACTGCGQCAAKCPKKAITMRERRAPRNKADKIKKAPAAAKPAAAKPAAVKPAAAAQAKPEAEGKKEA